MIVIVFMDSMILTLVIMNKLLLIWLVLLAGIKVLLIIMDSDGWRRCLLRVLREYGLDLCRSVLLFLSITRKHSSPPLVARTVF
jgi:hypothetical protein